MTEEEAVHLFAELQGKVLELQQKLEELESQRSTAEKLWISLMCPPAWSPDEPAPIIKLFYLIQLVDRGVWGIRAIAWLIPIFVTLGGAAMWINSHWETFKTVFFGGKAG